VTNEFTKHIKKRSIDNTRLGEVLTKDETTYTVRVGNTVISCSFDGDAYVGEYVTLVCPGGDISKAYIISTTAIGIGKGGNETI
jgi:hypothetical protein